jgi:speckle-type POZ protein
MTDSSGSSSQGVRPTKRIKVAGYTSYGNVPKEFLGNKEMMQFQIHDFANLQEKRGEYIYTNTIKAHGHLWKLYIYPRGDLELKTDYSEYVSFFLKYAGENTKNNSVLAKPIIRTETINAQHLEKKYSKKNLWGWSEFSKREDIIKNDCNDAGTLTITVELQVATEKKSVWFPQLNYCDNIIGTQLYGSTKASDILFIVGNGRKEFVGHKCIISLRAGSLYDLILTEEQSSSADDGSSGNDDESGAIKILLPDLDEFVFETLLKFIYTDEVPKLEKYDNDDDNNINEKKVKSILLTADRFGCTDLKLYMESILIEKFLVPSTVAGLLLLADSHSCALLKEATMNMYASNSKDVMESSQDDWTKLKESNDLLVELLVYATSSRKEYSSVVDDGNGTIEDVDNFDVTSLRDRLQKVSLNVDGSRDYLVELWKNYLRANTKE